MVIGRERVVELGGHGLTGSTRTGGTPAGRRPVRSASRWACPRHVPPASGCDLFPCKGKQILAVQTTSTGVAERIAKIRAEPRAQHWLDCGGLIEVWGWRKLKVKRGGTAVRYELRVETVTEIGVEQEV